jgi:hypothetical protein
MDGQQKEPLDDDKEKFVDDDNHEEAVLLPRCRRDCDHFADGGRAGSLITLMCVRTKVR